jgi:hypothetical protein
MDKFWDKVVDHIESMNQKHGVEGLWGAHAQMQQSIARMTESAEELTAVQEENALQKKHIAQQDARALHMETQHAKYAEGMAKSFSSLQDEMQVFVLHMLDNAAEQLAATKQSSDMHERRIAEHNAVHKEYVQELTQSFDAKLAEQIKRSEVTETNTRTEQDAVHKQHVQELTQYFDVKLAEQIKRSEVTETNTRAELQLVSQELFDVKQGTCLPPLVSTAADLDIWNDEATFPVCSVESINAFLDGQADMPMSSDHSCSLLTTTAENAYDDEIARGLAEAAFGQKRATEDASPSGLCSFDLQALVYSHAGTVRDTNKAAKHLPEQQAGAQARTQQPTAALTAPAWNPPPRELCCCVTLAKLTYPQLIQRCSDLRVPSHVHAAATFKFKVGDRVSAKYKKCHYKWPGEIFNRHAAEDGTATYSVSFDDGDVATGIKEKFMDRESPATPKLPVAIMAPVILRDLLRTYPSLE